MGDRLSAVGLLGHNGLVNLFHFWFHIKKRLEKFNLSRFFSLLVIDGYACHIVFS